MLKEFNAFTEVEPSKLLKHSSICWLNLHQHVWRFIKQWKPLHTFFMSNTENEKRGRVKRCSKSLASEEMYLYYLFLDSAHLPLMEFNTMCQSDETKNGVMSEEIKHLLWFILGRFAQPRVIKAAKDLCSVDFTNKDNLLPDEVLHIGEKARCHIVCATLT